MIHFDFYDRYEDEPLVGSAISRREGILLSIIVHLTVIILMMYGPELEVFERGRAALERRQQELAERQREREREERRFVFVQPRVDFEARARERAELSDLDRRSQAPVRATEPQNRLPFALGNSPERVEAAQKELKQGPETEVEPNEEPPRPQPEERLARNLPPAEFGVRPGAQPSRPAPGLLGDALRNLQRYIENETFHNPQGGALDPGATIQFDTKGVDFGPWLRRFVAEVRRNWFIPQAALTFSGRVVLQFNIHRNGHITDLVIARPSSIEAFTRAAYNAILGSNPVEPLPPEYPDPFAAFTVTFYYNEPPP